MDTILHTLSCVDGPGLALILQRNESSFKRVLTLKRSTARIQALLAVTLESWTQIIGRISHSVHLCNVTDHHT